MLAGSVAFGVAAAAGPLALPAEAAPPHPATIAATSTASPSSGLSPSPAASAQVRIAPRGKLLGVGARGFSWTDMQAERIRWTAYDDGRTVDLGSSRLVPGSLFEWDADSSDLVARVEYDENWVLQAVSCSTPSPVPRRPSASPGWSTWARTAGPSSEGSPWPRAERSSAWSGCATGCAPSGR
ncbi:hypothetical protein ACM614_14555 [Streptomyces sp. 12297]